MKALKGHAIILQMRRLRVMMRMPVTMTNSSVAVTDSVGTVQCPFSFLFLFLDRVS